MIISNPGFIASNQLKTRMLNNWATGYAMGNQSLDITANQGFANQANYGISRERI